MAGRSRSAAAAATVQQQVKKHYNNIILVLGCVVTEADGWANRRVGVAMRRVTWPANASFCTFVYIPCSGQTAGQG